jgi:hypothetical protein
MGIRLQLFMNRNGGLTEKRLNLSSTFLLQDHSVWLELVRHERTFI